MLRERTHSAHESRWPLLAVCLLCALAWPVGSRWFSVPVLSSYRSIDRVEAEANQGDVVPTGVVEIAEEQGPYRYAGRSAEDAPAADSQ
jgi:hypothetical protein